MNFDIDQPIAALASPPGGAARGIVRISGKGVYDVLNGWFRPEDQGRWQTARTATAHLGRLQLDADLDPIDCPVQVLYWPDRRSYTGQPLIELHLTGAPCLLEVVLGEIYRRGVRVARPGEFTLRAFLAGKLDLFQAEAVLGVIDAQDHVELKTALSQLAGGVSGRLAHLRRDLLELLADLEAGLDFVDEDIEFVSRAIVKLRLQSAVDYVSDVLKISVDRMQTRVRSKVVLAGLPNAGKSTLFNRLVGGNVAIVSAEQGTTRDFLTRSVVHRGLTFDLVDTAGWEDISKGIKAEAQKQRLTQVEESDVLVWCTSTELTSDQREIDDNLFAIALGRSRGTIRVQTKSDLSLKPANGMKPNISHTSDREMLTISVTNEAGIEELLAAITDRLTSEATTGGQWLGMTAARCRETLESVASSLQNAANSAASDENGDELISVDLREALDQLGAILGVIYTDDILDRIFSKFCIGK